MIPSSHGESAARTPIHAPVSRSYAGPFGRLFRNLPAWEPAGDSEAARIDAIAELAREMVETRDQGGDNEKIPAGYTYFGQFVDHDLTFDPRSSLQKAMDPERLENFRTPAFDLDCLYGRGFDDQPYLYDADGRFLIGTNGLDEDLPRNEAGRALIGDKRNDENTFVSQLQLVFLKFHNFVFDNRARSDFEEAHRIVRWHYQWVVVHDWLKLLCGKELVDELLTGSGVPGGPKLRYYDFENRAFMPVEFSVAAYRIGHSMVRGGYQINETVRNPTFSRAADNNPTGDFRGFRPLPQGWTIDWARFFAFTDQFKVEKPQPSRRIDRFLVGPLIEMPDAIADPVAEAPQDVNRSLAMRNLLRGWRLGLPSGQWVARRIGAKSRIDGPELPLWRYILEEAFAQQSGERLGEVGARIVAETFVGLLAADPSSYYSMAPNWRPDLPSLDGEFKLRDIVKLAGARIG